MIYGEFKDGWEFPGGKIELGETAETKGSMESLDLRPIEQAKITCAKKLFNEISKDDVVYDQVDSYQNLLSLMNAL